jgi:hypothetical protein
MFPNYIQETLDKYSANSDVQENKNVYILNQQDDIEAYDDKPNNFSSKKKLHLATLKLIMQLYKIATEKH